MTPVLMMTTLLVIGMASASPEPPGLYCRTNALDKVQRKRQQELLELMRRSAVEKQDLADGYAFRLAADPALFQQAAEWIGLERRCCPFVQFALEWRTDETVWVRFTGGPGVKQFLAAEIFGADRLP